MSNRTLEEGDTVLHKEYGEVIFKGVVQNMEEVMFTDTGSEVTLDGGTVSTSEVVFHEEENPRLQEQKHREQLQEFIKNTELV